MLSRDGEKQENGSLHCLSCLSSLSCSGQPALRLQNICSWQPLSDSVASPSHPQSLFSHSINIYQLPTTCRCCSRHCFQAVTEMHRCHPISGP